MLSALRAQQSTIINSTSTLKFRYNQSSIAPPPYIFSNKIKFICIKSNAAAAKADLDKSERRYFERDCEAEDLKKTVTSLKLELLRAQEKLEEAGFEWRIVPESCEGYSRKFEKKWEMKYEKLKLFKAEFGHCLVPGDYKRDKSLGGWVSKQRKMLLSHR